jgi:hypothetical protein
MEAGTIHYIREDYNNKKSSKSSRQDDLNLQLRIILRDMGGISGCRELKDARAIRILVIFPTGKTGTSGITTRTPHRTQLALLHIGVPVKSRRAVAAIRVHIIPRFAYAARRRGALRAIHPTRETEIIFQPVPLGTNCTVEHVLTCKTGSIARKASCILQEMLLLAGSACSCRVSALKTSDIADRATSIHSVEAIIARRKGRAYEYE